MCIRDRTGSSAGNASSTPSGGSAHRMLRRRLWAAPEQHGAARTQHRAEQIDEVAYELRADPLTVKLAITQHRKRLNRRIRNRRHRHVIDQLVTGSSNAEIGAALHFSKAQVTYIVRQVRTEARDLGISLFDLRDQKTPGVLS